MLPGSKDGWVRCDADGKILEEEKEGKRVPVERITNNQMRKRAKFNLPTGYNPNPTETTAEILTYLRFGGASLRQLIKECPEAYEIGKELDKADIIETYGYLKVVGNDKKETETKEPRYIRNEHGALVANTEEARKKFAEFEAKAKAGKAIENRGI